MLEAVTKHLRRIPAPSLVLGATGWALGGVFFLFWLFDVGKGPLDSSLVGPAGEWVSGLATAGTLAVTLYVLLHDRHTRAAEEMERHRRSEMDKLFGSFPQEQALVEEAKRLVPIRGEWRRVDEPHADEALDRASEGKYVIDFDLYNGLDRPLGNLTVSLSLTGDWTGKDYKSKQEYPPSVRLCDRSIVPPGDFFRFHLDNGGFFNLPVERVEAGAHLRAKWTVGEYEYDWNYFGPSQRLFLFVNVPEAIKERERKAREAFPEGS